MTLGIDLGTTYSVAATCDKGEVSVVVDDAIGSMGASANDAAVVEVGSVVGAKAAALRDAVPALTVYDAKRLIGREFDDPVVQEELEHLPFHVVENQIQPRPRDAAIGATMQGKALPYKRLMPSDRANLVVIPPEEVGARILSHLKRHSERSLPFFRRNLGFTFGSLTVSVPVGFTKAQRAATLRAATRAGFATARLLEEPVAAAIAYGLHEDDVERTVIVYDLGGGTLDVAVLRLERSSKTFLVLGTSGDPHLGGEDFDRALVGWLWRELNSEGFRAPADDELSLSRWEETALRVMERAKRALSESERVGDEDSWDEDPPGLTCTTRWLTRDDLATSCATLVDRAMAPVREALRNAGNVDPDEIDDVVIVGGSSRLAVIRQRLSEAFHGRDIHHTVNPDTAIAVGAARSYAC
ncbi:heat shock protein 70 [Micromonas commoda]|uniref:Heat shock protein 70 n=1 Tax=Micromonas commoda (strain RCC299 / NOUM17 / CCMP2709) TaxID=296587 RepID=C1E314_MICCC|nr:heat shock protein 70 [Micromonas commoda]ACO62438.1 heat shock protein 70 [Micromonas commoda]|eukprot:XP_002501180.1 heat shock protein 70 [Micromonas commoda]